MAIWLLWKGLAMVRVVHVYTKRAVTGLVGLGFVVYLRFLVSVRLGSREWLAVCELCVCVLLPSCAALLVLGAIVVVGEVMREPVGRVLVYVYWEFWVVIIGALVQG